MKAFVDKDVILDVLLERKYFVFSAKVIELIEKKDIEGFTSPIILTNTYYLIAKEKNSNLAWNVLRRLRSLFKITKVNENIIDQALTSGFKDFEDAVQYYCAVENKVKYLVTRNKSDYRGDEVIIASPQEIIAIFEKN